MQKYFGNNMSVHDSELARRYSSQAPSSGHMSPLSGAPVEVDDGSASEDDDYDDRRTTADDGYSHATRDDRRTYDDVPRPSAEELKEQQESRTRRAIRVEYRLLHKAGVVSNKNYNIMTTPVALLMDDLEDLRIDSRIDQWTGIVKDVVVYLAQFIEFANYRFLNGRFALQRYGKFMESRIPFLRPKIVRVAGLMVKNGATINPIFDLVLAFAGQTIMFVTMNQITQNMQQNLGALPPAATPARQRAAAAPAGPTPKLVGLAVAAGLTLSGGVARGVDVFADARVDGNRDQLAYAASVGLRVFW